MNRATSHSRDLLERLRRFRAPARSTPTLAGELGAQMHDIARRRRALGAVGELWDTLLPADLRDRVHPRSLRRAVLTVRAADSAAAFELDRWLRSGGNDALRAAAGVRRVKVDAGPVPPGRPA